MLDIHEYIILGFFVVFCGFWFFKNPFKNNLKLSGLSVKNFLSSLASDLNDLLRLLCNSLFRCMEVSKATPALLQA